MEVAWDGVTQKMTTIAMGCFQYRRTSLMHAVDPDAAALKSQQLSLALMLSKQPTRVLERHPSV